MVYFVCTIAHTKYRRCNINADFYQDDKSNFFGLNNQKRLKENK